MINLQELIPTDFSPQSKVWVYQASRVFHLNEAFELEQILADFVAQWQSHGAPVKGFANLFFGRFIVLMADESDVTVGGCSTDSSVHMLRAIEKRFNLSLFNREVISFYVNDKVEPIPLSQLEYAFANGNLNQDSLFFDNTVVTKQQFLNRWITPVQNSWIGKRYLIRQS